MCLNVTAENTYASKAKETIVCYKVLKCKEMPDGKTALLSWFRDFPYELGKTYTEDKFVDHELFGVEVGFHSYAEEKSAKADASIYNWGSHDVIVRCEIPKGTKYFTGRYSIWKSYCSKSIKLTGIKYYRGYEKEWDAEWTEPEVKKSKPNIFKRLFCGLIKK